MKYVVILGDGMADRPFASFGGKTALEVAKKPNLDRLAENAILGMAKTVPDSMPPGSDTANLSVLGYNPKQYYSGRSPFEAYSIGLRMEETDISFRCNFVTLEAGHKDLIDIATTRESFEQTMLVDHSSDELSTEEARILLQDLSTHFREIGLLPSTMTFHTGVSYRHILLWNEGPYDWKLTPPHDILGRPVAEYMPADSGSGGSALLQKLMKASYPFLSAHPVNQARVEKGLRPGNSIWLWGEGRKPVLTSFPVKYGKTGAVISAVDLIKGLGLCAGLRSIDVDGATGNLHTNYAGKVNAALEALRSGDDFVYLHIEAPDECSHRFEPENKVKAIEWIDEKVVGPILSGLKSLNEPFRLLVLPDHPTPLEIRTHSNDPVPFLFYSSSKSEPFPISASTSGPLTEKVHPNYSESYCSSTGFYFSEGFSLMDFFMNDTEPVQHYTSTRGRFTAKASEAILSGIAPDGGLFVPSNFPKLSMPLNALLSLNYQHLALEIMRLFLSDYTEEELRKAISSAYDEKFDTPLIAPVVWKENFGILELFHGRTLAFKDMALSILPYLLTTAVKKNGLEEEVVILTATSGDTGKAALEGFADVPGTKIIVFFPEHGVSEIQKLQMVTQVGENVHVLGINGNFDDAQKAVKKMFTDETLKNVLKDHGMAFSSANSINIGRLVPQVVYYFWAYKQAVDSGYIHLGELLNFTVPTGNFGNILAGYYGKKLGLPIGKLLCASNENKVLYDFFETGIYDRRRDFSVTSSPSMDILVSSNLERLLYHLAEEMNLDAAETVSELMEALNTRGHYELPPPMFEKLSDFCGGFATEENTSEGIAALYASTGYVMDTHTAVAYHVAKENPTFVKNILLSTASPYKFPEAVLDALSALPESREFMGLSEKLSDSSATAIPQVVKSLERAVVIHKKVCDLDELEDAVKEFLSCK